MVSGLECAKETEPIGPPKGYLGSQRPVVPSLRRVDRVVASQGAVKCPTSARGQIVGNQMIKDIK